MLCRVCFASGFISFGSFTSRHGDVPEDLARKLPRGQPLGPTVGCNLIADALPQSADVVGDAQVRTDQHHAEVGFCIITRFETATSNWAGGDAGL